MENVGAVDMGLDALHFPGIDIAANVAALFDDQHRFARPGRLMGKHRAVKPRANHKIVIWLHSFKLQCQFFRIPRCRFSSRNSSRRSSSAPK